MSRRWVMVHWREHGDDDDTVEFVCGSTDVDPTFTVRKHIHDTLGLEGPVERPEEPTYYIISHAIMPEGFHGNDVVWL